MWKKIEYPPEIAKKEQKYPPEIAKKAQKYPPEIAKTLTNYDKYSKIVLGDTYEKKIL